MAQNVCPNRIEMARRVHYALDCWFDVGSRKAKADPQGIHIHREAAKQVAGTRGADLLSFDRRSGARSLVRVMSGKGKGGVGHRISPPRPQVNPRGSRRSSSSARAGPRMGQSMQYGWPLRPILTWRWLVSAPGGFTVMVIPTLPALAVHARRWASLITTSLSRCKECSRSGRLGRLSYLLSSRNRSTVEGE